MKDVSVPAEMRGEVEVYDHQWSWTATHEPHDHHCHNTV